MFRVAIEGTTIEDGSFEVGISMDVPLALSETLLLVAMGRGSKPTGKQPDEFLRGVRRTLLNAVNIFSVNARADGVANEHFLVDYARATSVIAKPTVANGELLGNSLRPLFTILPPRSMPIVPRALSGAWIHPAIIFPFLVKPENIPRVMASIKANGDIHKTLQSVGYWGEVASYRVTRTFSTVEALRAFGMFMHMFLPVYVAGWNNVLDQLAEKYEIDWGKAIGGEEYAAVIGLLEPSGVYAEVDAMPEDPLVHPQQHFEQLDVLPPMWALHSGPNNANLIIYDKLARELYKRTPSTNERNAVFVNNILRAYTPGPEFTSAFVGQPLLADMLGLQHSDDAEITWQIARKLLRARAGTIRTMQTTVERLTGQIDKLLAASGGTYVRLSGEAVTQLLAHNAHFFPATSLKQINTHTFDSEERRAGFTVICAAEYRPRYVAYWEKERYKIPDRLADVLRFDVYIIANYKLFRESASNPLKGNKMVLDNAHLARETNGKLYAFKHPHALDNASDCLGTLGSRLEDFDIPVTMDGSQDGYPQFVIEDISPALAFLEAYKRATEIINTASTVSVAAIGEGVAEVWGRALLMLADDDDCRQAIEESARESDIVRVWQELLEGANQDNIKAAGGRLVTSIWLYNLAKRCFERVDGWGVSSDQVDQTDAAQEWLAF